MTAKTRGRRVNLADMDAAVGDGSPVDGPSADLYRGKDGPLGSDGQCLRFGPQFRDQRVQLIVCEDFRQSCGEYRGRGLESTKGAHCGGRCLIAFLLSTCLCVAAFGPVGSAVLALALRSDPCCDLICPWHTGQASRFTNSEFPGAELVEQFRGEVK